jgi:hypothetical protein
MDSDFARAKTLNRVFDSMTRPTVIWCVLGCTVGDESVERWYHSWIGAAFLQARRFPCESLNLEEVISAASIVDG